jgi:hypothetical protein
MPVAAVAVEEVVQLEQEVTEVAVLVVVILLLPE